MGSGIMLRKARQFRRRLALISALSILASAATLAIPWLAGQFLAGVLSGGSGDIVRTSLLLLAALVSLTIVTILVAIVSEDASGRILADLRAEIHEHLQCMSVAFHDRTRDGEMLSLMTQEISRLSGFLTNTLAQAPSMLITAAGALILLAVIDPALALLVPLLVPAFFVAFKLVGRRLRKLARDRRDAEVDVFNRANIDLEMVEAVKAFAVEEQRRAGFRAAVEKSRQIGLAQVRASAFVGPVFALLAAAGAIAILLIAGRRMADGAMQDPAELLSFLFYAALLTRPVGQLADLYGAFQIARGTLARLEEVFEAEPEPGYRLGQAIERARGAINFENVSFAYEGRRPVLENLNLSISQGEIVALTGENGIGKTTLVRLILRFYEPDSGRVTLDSADIADLQVQDLRRQFGYVPQTPLLFDGTVAENVTLGMSDADPASLERAARLAQAWDFIQHLPAGFETRIGDGGVRLSGGQRQRLALTRALLRDPPIYILDEATSMYDLEGEAAFVDSCIGSLKGRTVILITHRPASLALADRIIHPSDLGFTLQKSEEG